MSYFSIEKIRESCPYVDQSSEEPNDLIIVGEKDEFNPELGMVNCVVPVDMKLDPPTFGCRKVIQVSSTGCPLRDGRPVKVLIGGESITHK